MNDTATSAPGASLVPHTTDIFTAGHLAIIAILALLAIAALIYGMRLARRRREAERELVEHNAEVREEVAPAAPPPPLPPVAAPRPVPVQPAPVPPESFAPPLVRDEGFAPPPERTDVPAPAPAPAVVIVAPAPAAPSGPSPTDGPITQLKGLGPKVAALLAQHGITTVGQMAALTDDEAHALDARLGPFTGRMGRDRWQEQARFLAAGDVKGFEAVFGRL